MCNHFEHVKLNIRIQTGKKYKIMLKRGVCMQRQLENSQVAMIITRNIPITINKSFRKKTIDRLI